MAYEIIWQGRNPNWIGDLRHQVIFRISAEMGVSILGPEELVSPHGAPTRMPGYELGVQGIVDTLQHDADLDLKVAAIRFIDKPELPSNHASGLSFRPVGYLNSGDAYERVWSGQEVLQFMATIAQHGTKGIRADHYLDAQWKHQQAQDSYKIAWQNRKYLLFVDRTNPIYANPSPITEPAVFAYCQVTGRISSVDKVAGIFVWTQPCGGLQVITLGVCLGKLLILDAIVSGRAVEYPAQLEAASALKAPASFLDFVSQVRSLCPTAA